MSPGQTRDSVMMEIAQLDAKINGLVAQMPRVTSAGSYPFPWFLWLIGGAGVACYYFADQIPVPQIADYKMIILIAGAVFCVLALLNSLRSLRGPSRGSTGRSRQLTAQVDELQRKRAVLRQQLQQLGG